MKIKLQHLAGAAGGFLALTLAATLFTPQSEAQVIIPSPGGGGSGDVTAALTNLDSRSIIFTNGLQSLGTVSKSVRIGTNVTASGNGGIAIGSELSAAEAVVIGRGSTGTVNSVVIGQGAISTVTDGTAIGGQTSAGEHGTAVGDGAIATIYGTAIGHGAKATNTTSTAIGAFSSTDANDQVKIGTGTSEISIPGELHVGDKTFFTNNVTVAGTLAATNVVFAESNDETTPVIRTFSFTDTAPVWQATAGSTLGILFNPWSGTNYLLGDLNIGANNYFGGGANLTFDASGFDGNLSTDDDTLQELAQAVDDLVLTGSGTFDFASLTNKPPGIHNVSTNYGANLTNLNASSISSGTIADARLSSNVPLKDAVNHFSVGQIVTNAANASHTRIDGNSLWNTNGWATGPMSMLLTNGTAAFTNGSGYVTINAAAGGLVVSGSANIAGLSADAAGFGKYPDVFLYTGTGLSGSTHGLRLSSSAAVLWSSGDYLSAPDTAISRVSAGVVGVGAVTATNGFLRPGIFTATSSFTLTATNDVVAGNISSGTITAPTAVGIKGKGYEIINLHSSDLTIARTSSQTFNGVDADLVLKQGQWAVIRSDGANWLMIRGDLGSGAVGGGFFIEDTDPPGGESYTNLVGWRWYTEGDLAIEDPIGQNKIVGNGGMSKLVGLNFTVDETAYVDANGDAVFNSVEITTGGTLTADNLAVDTVTVGSIAFATNTYGSAVVDFSVSEATTNMAGNLTFTGITGFDSTGATNYYHFVLHCLPNGSDRTITPAAGWRKSRSAFVVTNGTMADIFIEAQIGVFTNISQVDFF